MYIFILFGIIILFVISLIFNSLTILLACIVAMIIFNIIYSLADFQKRITFLAMQVTFFTFLLGKIIINLFNNNDFGLQFSDMTIKHIFICLFISLLFLYLGYTLSCKLTFVKIGIKNINTRIIKNRYCDNEIYNIRHISKLFFYITYIPYILTLMEKVIFVQSTSYIEYYTNFSQSIPFWIQKIGEMALPSFFIFIATMPSKKEVRFPVLLYLLYGIISLGYGQRNQFVLMTLMIIIYYIIRNKVCPKGEVWFSKTMMISCIIAIPIMILFLGAFAYWREHLQMNFTSLGNIFVDFFNAQGGSVNIIGYGFDYRKLFPKNQNYTFGPIINFFQENIFSRLIFNTKSYSQNTIEMALNGNIFGQTITYLVMPWNYVNGIGMGSCYIAEVFKDFGYIGVCIINFIYGSILSKGSKLLSNNIWISAIYYIMIYQILYSPRNTALSFITSSLNLINVITFISIYVVVLLSKRKHKKVIKID